MSKLWIVHRQAARREALVRLCGLSPEEVVSGHPSSDAFAASASPAAIVLAVEDDAELELDFCHRHRSVLTGSRRLILTSQDLAPELSGLFGVTPEEIVVGAPDERALRRFVRHATAHRNAESLAERSDRERIAARFSAWLGGLEVPGLLRVLDPALAALPLLVRGVPGSGRRLLCRYVELFRTAGRPTLQLHASEISSMDVIESRITARAASGKPPYRTIWIDELETLSASAQRALADWIRMGTVPGMAQATRLRWLATAGPAGLDDGLEPSLARAFAPLEIEIPALADHLETLPDFVDAVLSDWATTVGGPRRSLSPAGLEALGHHAWPGDREAVEAILRTTLAASSSDPIEPADLATSTAPKRPITAPVTETASAPVPPAPVERHRGEAVETTRASVTHDVLDPSDAIDPSAALDAADASGAVFADLEPAVFYEGEDAASTEDSAPSSLFSGAPILDERLVAPSQSEPAPESADPSVAMMEETFGLSHETTADPAPASGANPVSESPAAEATPRPDDGGSWRRLARSLSHEIRNPLVSIRTFAELLPEHFEDPEFRTRFTELVGRDVSHIDEVVTRLADAARGEEIVAERVDVSALLEGLLDARRDAIARDRLLVLRELEREAPIAWADPKALEVALAGLLDRALASLPERGDLFVATRRIDRAADGEPRLRVLLRHHNPDLRTSAGDGLAELHPDANALEYVLAETIISACGGRLTLDTTDALETLILVDLRTPA